MTNAGTPDANYPAPTPHAANVAHTPYQASTNVSDPDGNIPFGINESSDGSAGSAVDSMTVAQNAGWGPKTTSSEGLLNEAPNDLAAAQGSVKAFDAMAGLTGAKNVSGLAQGFDHGSPPNGPVAEADMGTPREDGIQFGSPGTYGFDNP